jgi:hypothetical protein
LLYTKVVLKKRTEHQSWNCTHGTFECCFLVWTSKCMQRSTADEGVYGVSRKCKGLGENDLYLLFGLCTL